MKFVIDEINPIYRLSSEDIDSIKEIDRLLSKITFDDENKKQSAKKESQVRSIFSSLAIEANSLSYEEVNRICDKKSVLADRKEIQEVRNAIELYENMSKYNWCSEKDLQSSHSLLMKYLDEDNDEYRKHGEGVMKGNNLVFQAPESILVPGLMESLFEFIRTNEGKVHPIVLSSIFHYYFVYIHPYTDGNGRTARFWVSLMLSDYNEAFRFLPIEETLYKYQKQYYKAIESCHANGNANEFVSFMISVIKETVINTTQKTTQKKNSDLILECIRNNPNVTRKELAVYLDITEDGAKYHLNKLKKEKLIERVGADKGGYWKIIEGEY